MKKTGPIKTVYYKDELGDEFSSAVITPKKIDASYIYDRDGFGGKFLHFFWYRLVAIPLGYCYLKLAFHHKIIGREKLRDFAKKPLFIYGNHTQAIADALIPTFITHPRDAYVVVHPNNVSMPFLGRITPYLGALPLPDDLDATRNYRAIIEKRIRENAPVYIYPEAHIWPYFTGIRHFTELSFHYPVKYDTPVFCFTNTYRRRRFSSKPRIVTYVDGPFFADGSLPPKERKKELRDRVLECMTERSRLSDAVRIEYRKEGDSDSD